MSNFGAKLRDYFLNTYSHKEYIQYFLAPQPYSQPTFTINWFIPSFIEKDYLANEISNKLSIEKYPGRVMLGIIGSYLLDHNRFSAVISLEINPSNLNQDLFDSFLVDFDNLVSKYERIYEIKKPFSTERNDFI